MSHARIAQMRHVQDHPESLELLEKSHARVAERARHAGAIGIMASAIMRWAGSAEAEVPADRMFEAKPVWKRMIVILAGVTMNAPADPSSLQVVLVLEMSGVREAYESLSAAGVPFLAEPYSPPWGGHRCFAVDPDGYLVELEEPA